MEQTSKTTSTGGTVASPMGTTVDVAERLNAFRDWVTASPRALSFSLAILIVGIALIFRLWGVNWDNGNHLHPDERFLSFVTNDVAVPGSINDYFDSSESSFSPYNRGHGQFVYGTFPLFTTKIAGETADSVENKPLISPLFHWLFNNDTGRDMDLGGYEANLIGRVLSALFDVASIGMIFLIGRRLFDKRVAYLGAFLVSITVFHIQLSHFFAVDTFLTFFTLCVIYFSVRIAQGGGWWNYTLAGLCYGLALACKISALSLVGMVFLAILIRAWPAIIDLLSHIWPSLRPREEPESAPASAPALAWSAAGPFTAPGEAALAAAAAATQAPVAAAAAPTAKRPTLIDHAFIAAVGLLLGLAATFFIFRIAQPYAFNGPHFWDLSLSEAFKDDMRSSLELQSGQDYPPNVQWIGRTSYIWPMQNMIIWGMGPALGIAAWLGFVYVGWRLLFRKDTKALIPFVWCAFVFLYWGGRFNPIMRSFLPMYPTLILLGAYALIELWDAAPKAGAALSRLRPTFERWRSPLQFALRGTVVAVVAATFLYALAFTHIYRTPVSRVEAGQWLSAYAPEGSHIASESWDDGLPLNGSFQFVEMKTYDWDNADKIDQLIASLDQTDFITITSNRVYKSVPQVPAEYPETVRYYDLLFSGQLGFKQVKTFTSYPTLFGVSIPDQGAEESFTVYDHPEVRIFQKTPEYSHARVESLLSQARADAGIHLTPKIADTNGLLFRPDDLKSQTEGGTWSDIFNPDSIPNRIPLWTWLLVVELISLSVVPATLLLFRSLPDRGYLLAKPLGFLVLGYLVWLAASFHVMPFTRTTIGSMLLLMLLAGGAVAYLTRVDLKQFVRDRWRSIVLWESLFLGAFLLFYIIRLDNPDLWHPARGGEKPMDFAYLNAIIHSTYMPPIDPWYGGGYMNYYYFGQFLTAMLAKFTGILPEVSYNLAVPLFFALAVGAAYSIGFNLAEATRRFVRRRPAGTRIGPLGPVLAGLGTVFLVMVVGNLGGAKQLVDNLSTISPWHVDAPVIGGAVATIGGLKARIFDGQHLELPTDWYWGPSRMMPPTISITEFPYFSYLFADLHAHMMAIPFALTSLAVGVAVVLNATRLLKESPRYRYWAGWALVVVLAFVIGALRWINSWDYPPFLLMAIAAIFISERVTESKINLVMLWRTALKTGALLALTVIFFYPFQANYELPATGFHRMEGRETTPFNQYAAHFGVFLFIIGGYLAFLAWRSARRLGPRRLFGWLTLSFVAAVLAGILVVGLAGPAMKRAPGDLTVTGLSGKDFLQDTVAGAFGPLQGPSPVPASRDAQAVRHATPVVTFSLAGIALLAVLAWFAMRRVRGDGAVRLFVLGMVGLALILSAGVEIAVLDGDIQRMNTVFKFYLHIWLLLALAAGFGLWYIVDVIQPRFALSTATEPERQPATAPIAAAQMPATAASSELPADSPFGAPAAATPADPPAVAPAPAPARALPALPFSFGRSRLLISAFTVCAVGFIIAALVYPLVATPQRVRDRFENETAVQPQTDNGLDYMVGAVFDDEHGPLRLADDYLAIQWMRENVKGSPIIMEGVTPNYRWGNRFAINTGLPAVMGWEWHQIQQRGKIAEYAGEDYVTGRTQEVDTFYSTNDAQLAQYTLEKYNVRYVIVGALERYYYPEPGIDKLESGLGGMLRLVYKAGDTNIYEVQQPPPISLSTQ